MPNSAENLYLWRQRSKKQLSSCMTPISDWIPTWLSCVKTFNAGSKMVKTSNSSNLLKWGSVRRIISNILHVADIALVIAVWKNTLIMKGLLSLWRTEVKVDRCHLKTPSKQKKKKEKKYTNCSAHTTCYITCTFLVRIKNKTFQSTVWFHYY